MGFSAEQQRKEKKIVLKRSLCDFVIGAAFQEYFCERGKGQLFTSQRDVVGLVINEYGLLIFNPKCLVSSSFL